MTTIEPNRDLPYKNRFQNAITYEVTLTLTRYFRRVYSILDFLSEIGGLFSTFTRLFLLIITGLNYFGSYQFVMRELFYDRAGSGGFDPFVKNKLEPID